MVCTLTVTRYPRFMGWAGVLSMAVFRIALWFRKDPVFWKLMGSGRNGTFDLHPDWRQWALLTVSHEKERIPDWFMGWWQFFGCEKWRIELEPIEGFGSWDGKNCFGEIPRESGYEGRIAVLTRATIRASRLKEFWLHVPAVAERTASAEGFITSLGIGEMPLIKQATFSIWESKAAMKAFAYRMQEHSNVIRQTRKRDWYREEMFIRFKILSSGGTLRGKDPLQGKN